MSTTNKKAYVFEMNLVAANVFSLVVFAIAFVVTSILFGWNNYFSSPFIYTSLISYFCLHEAMHAFGYLLGGCDPKKIAYGILLEKGIFYCMCYQEITKKNILISLQMPFTFLTVIVYILAYVFQIPFLAFLAVVNFMGASMDMAMFYYISKISDVHYSESGAPNEFVLISSEDLTKRKSIFLRLKEIKDYKKEDYQFQTFKRFTCTKLSYILLLVLVGLDLICYLLG